MRNIFFALALIFSTGILAADESELSQYEEENFIETLQQELQKQQNRVNALKAQIARKDIIAPGAINNQFENAYTMLNVKQTLYNNFVGTPSIKSPLVKEKLLQIFRKDLVTPGDLSELEALVAQERPKYVKPETSSTPTTGIAK